MTWASGMPLATIDALLAMGADPNLPNKSGITAHYLVMNMDDNDPMIAHLSQRWPKLFP
jgi:ankyrin repeat protein